MDSAPEQTTKILEAVTAGDEQAAERLLPLVYDELRRLAAAKLAQEPPGQTLQPTALVHEAWLRLVGSGNEHWKGRGHFFGAAAEAMRRILIDRARKRHRQRHGHGLVRIDFSQLDVAITTDDDLLLRVNEALEKLEVEAPSRAQLVKLRFFTGLNISEAAKALGIAPATAKRHWAFARAWLLVALKSDT
ncbi:RNA polymerase sigma-70 ECF-like protein [Verrucomicrobia bacterium]|nr:RNA polymerase sigma-70 ECF-like protein [Verrucomicrobiota bacterium]